MRVLLVISISLSASMLVLARQDVPMYISAKQYISQEAVDAVQNQKIISLEQLATATAVSVEDIRDKQSSILGGIAVLGLLFTGNIIVQLRGKGRG